MENLIKERVLFNDMQGGDTESVLEGGFSNLLARAIYVMGTREDAIELLDDPNGVSYGVDDRGITGYWVGRQENGVPITHWTPPLSQEEFLKWLSRQPSHLRETVHRNLETYINTETPKERGEIEFPEPQHAFGY